jgi:predicted small lipoprotein YifL
MSSHPLRRACALALWSLASCGGSTPLDLPRASDAAVVAADACAPWTQTTPGQRPEVLFVIDRSGSMQVVLPDGRGGGATRWALLRDALARVLPRYDAQVDTGVLLYPARDDYDACAPATEPARGLGPGNAEAILQSINALSPSGATPTASALDAARRYLRHRPGDGAPRFVVLATDGAPNCNPDIALSRCVCTVDAPGCARGSGRCLDDVRTRDAVAALAADGVQTFVVGIVGDEDAVFEETLRTLAAAGGRPNPIDPARGYYAVQREEDMARAFEEIQRTVARCAVPLARAPGASQPVRVSVDDVGVARDPARQDGWDWSDETRRAVVLHGAACARAQQSRDGATIEVGCL